MQGSSRRALLKKLAIAVALAPLAKLSSALARAERRRKNHAGAEPGSFWIGHC